MKMMTVGEFKSRFSDVISDVKSGEEIAVTFGRKKEIVGYFVPKKKMGNSPDRKLGILEGKATAIFNDDFKFSERDFVDL